MNWEEIVYDPGSTTKAFKFLSTNYSLEVLFSDFEGDIFKRVIVIKLDGVPVMVANSQTHVSNQKFVEILQNAHTTPIGVKLFAPNSGIKRGPMSVKQIDISVINDNVAISYIKALGVNSELYFRESTFKSDDEQTLELKEYILPGLKFIINRG